MSLVCEQRYICIALLSQPMSLINAHSLYLFVQLVYKVIILLHVFVLFNCYLAV